MAATVEQITELAMNLRLSKQTGEKLAQRATESGKDIAAVAADLIERAMARPTVDEVLAPCRKQVAESGMGDVELDAFLLRCARQGLSGTAPPPGVKERIHIRDGAFAAAKARRPA